MTTDTDTAPKLDPGVHERAELTLLREWAAHITVPLFLVDPAGTLVFYNEPAESLIGRRFDAAGEMPVSQLAEMFSTTTVDGEDIANEDLPLSIALVDHRPAHRRLRIMALDQASRVLEVTAFPLLRRDGVFMGAVALFWGREEGDDGS